MCTLLTVVFNHRRESCLLSQITYEYLIMVQHSAFMSRRGISCRISTLQRELFWNVPNNMGANRKALARHCHRDIALRWQFLQPRVRGTKWRLAFLPVQVSSRMQLQKKLSLQSNRLQSSVPHPLGQENASLTRWELYHEACEMLVSLFSENTKIYQHSGLQRPHVHTASEMYVSPLQLFFYTLKAWGGSLCQFPALLRHHE